MIFSLGVVPRLLDDRGNFLRVTAIRGSNVTLLCSAIAIPKPMIIWKKDGFSIAQRKMSIIFKNNGNELFCPRANESDAGLYTCEAGNYLGTIHRSFLVTVYGMLNW